MRSDITIVRKEDPPEGPGPHLGRRSAARPFKPAPLNSSLFAYFTAPSVAKAVTAEISASTAPAIDAPCRPPIKSSPCRDKDDAEQGGDDQPAGARNGAVEPRGGADMMLVDRAQHGRGQRRDRDRHAERDDQDRGQHRRPIARRPASIRRPSSEADGDDQRPDGQRPARPDPGGQLAHHAASRPRPGSGTAGRPRPAWHRRIMAAPRSAYRAGAPSARRARRRAGR